MSLFREMDHSISQGLKFWKPFENSPYVEIFSGELHELGKNGLFKKAMFSLTPTFFLKITSVKRKITNIEFKRFNAYIEENNSEIKYCFTIGYTGNSRDFYSDDKNTFDMWVNHFSRLSILSDIEGDYAIVREIGRGNFAQIFLAVNIETSCQYAIKAMNKSKFEQEKKSIENLVSEIRLLRKVNYTNIINLHSTFEDNDKIYFVLDLIGGDDLFSRLVAIGKFDELTVKRIAKSLLGILDHFGTLNIVHRDIKLENILMTSFTNNYEIKLGEFGLAAQIDQMKYIRCGSPGYIAPEVLNSDTYDTKIDLFSCGVVFYALLSGRLPFMGRNTREILFANREGRVHFREVY